MKILYTNSNGSLSIVHPLPKEAVEISLGPLTDEEYIKHVYAVSIPVDAANVMQVDDSAIPTNREARGSWTQDNLKEYVNV